MPARQPEYPSTKTVPLSATPASPPSPAPEMTECQSAEALSQACQLSASEVPLGGPLTVEASGSQINQASLLSRGRPSVPGYDILRPLGAGTYGEVWQGRDQSTGVLVAIKFFAHGTGLAWQLLQAEVKQLAQLDSLQGIIQLKDVEPSASPPYYVMAFAEHGSLAERLERGPLPLPEALAIFREAAEALAYVHAKGIRHCDLKPGNVLLDVRGRALLADFGQAHLSSDASPALGTFFYMAPEQADLEHNIPDTRWDVYGLGALFYAMLTGLPPRYDEKVRQELASQGNLNNRLKRYREWIPQAPRPDAHRRLPGMDRDLAHIIDRCLETDPARRLRDAGAVIDALNRRERRRQRRPLFLFGLLAPLFLVLVVAGLGSWAVERGIGQSQAALTEQQKGADLITAQLAAEVMGREMQERIDLLQHDARDQELAQILKEGHDPEGNPLRGDGADPYLRHLLQEFLRGRAEQKFFRWWIAKRDGWIAAVDPPPPTTFEPRSFAWREWFNGEGDKLEDKEHPWPAHRQAFHISRPYPSKTDGSVQISISVPILDPDGTGEPVGLLVGSVQPETLKDWLRDMTGVDDTSLILLNDRGQYLLPLQAVTVGPNAGDERFLLKLPSWQNDAEVSRRLLQERQPDQGTYTDRDTGQVYLMGSAPLKPNVGWGVIIKQPQEAVLRPVHELKRSMLLFGLTASGVVGLLVTGLWGWLFWTLRHTDRAGAYIELPGSEPEVS